MIGSKHLQQYDIIDPNHLPRLVSFTQVDPTKVLNLHIHAYELLSHWVMTVPKQGRFRADNKLALRVVLSIWERRPLLISRIFICEKLKCWPYCTFEISNLCYFQAIMLSKSPCQVFSLLYPCFTLRKAHGLQYYLDGYIFLPSVFFILLSHFCSFMVVWGVGVSGSGIGFVGLGSSFDGFGPVEWGPLAFLGSGQSI